MNRVIQTTGHTTIALETLGDGTSTFKILYSYIANLKTILV